MMRRSRILVLIMALFTGTFAFSQNMLQGEPTQEIREMANEEIRMWSSELGLRAKQEALMEEKIIEYAMRREEVLNSKMNEEAKAERMLILEDEERQDMRDILTKPQFERYLELWEQRRQEEVDKSFPQNNNHRK